MTNMIQQPDLNIYPEVDLTTGNVITPVAPVTPTNLSIGDYFTRFKENLRNYLTDPTKAPQQLQTNVNTASLGTKINTGLGSIAGLLQAYNSFNANKLAKRQLNHQIEAYRTNLDAQRKLTNSRLEDRQHRRVEEAQANGRTTTSVSDYMRKYGV